MKIISRCALVVILALTAGCAPRGETRTLDEVLRGEKEKYQQARVAELAPEVDAAIVEVSKNLEMVLGSDAPAAVGSLAAIAGKLDFLTTRAGYTSRASLSEIASQYRLLSDAQANPQQLKLLAARTYGLLASELTTTKFGVS